MTDPAEDHNELIDLEDVTPLRKIALEVHELQTELTAVGFPERLLTQVVAHLLFDLLTYREDESDENERDDEDEEEDYDPDGDI
jgi:hypothetical protein